MFYDDVSYDSALTQPPGQSSGRLEEQLEELIDSDRKIKIRRHDRYAFFRPAVWDFFTGSTGYKTGYVINISKSGCLLKASEPVDHRRWIRVMIQDPQSNVSFVQIGRVVRRQDLMEELSNGEITLYRYGVEFTHPSYLTLQDDLILALSSNNLTVRSCRSLKSTSSLRPASLE